VNITEQNKMLTSRWIEEVMHRKNLAAVDELFTPNLVDHALLPGLAPGIEGFKQLVSAHVYALPTLQVTIEEMS
jgi:SnoaL-like polyketide cyclase